MVFTAKCTVFCLASVLVLALATPGRAPNSEGDAHHPWPASAPSEASFDRLMAEAMERMGKDMSVTHSGDPDRDFAAMMILAPSCASRSAMALPIPRLAPVMNTVLLLNLGFS